MTADIYDLCTRTQARPFPQGRALMGASANRCQEILAEHGLTLRTTGPRQWTLRDAQGTTGRIFADATGWRITTQPQARARVEAAIQAMLDAPTPRAA